MIYRWQPGKWLGVPAQIAGDRIESIREHLGRVHPGDLVEDARPEDAPLHPCFEWDDSVAAEKWRLDQARAVLRALVILPSDVPDAEPVRAFIAIGSDNEPNDYMPLNVVMTDEELRRRTLRAALEDLNRVKARYQTLRELEKVWAALEEVPIAAVG